MSDTGTTSESNSEVLYAGKYKTPEALEEGYSNLRESMGLSKVEKPVGTGRFFPDHAALENEYKALISAKGRKANEGKNGEAKPPEGKAAPLSMEAEDKAPPADEDYDVDDILTRAGLDFKSLEKQWVEKGALSDEQYAAIRKVNPGLSRKIIDGLAKGMVLEAEIKNNAVISLHKKAAEIIGVEYDGLKDRIATMGKSVPDNRRAAINKMLADPDLMETGVRELMAHHAKGTGSEGSNKLHSGDGARGTSGVKDAKDLSKVLKGVEQGDAASIAALNATSVEDITNMGKFGY